MKYLVKIGMVLVGLNSFNCVERNSKTLNEAEVNQAVDVSTYWINPLADSIPHNFVPIDPLALGDSLYKHLPILVKDEFETTKEYDKRRELTETDIRRKYIYNRLTFDSIFTISMVGFVDDFKVFEYDADKEVLPIEISISSYFDMIRRREIQSEFGEKFYKDRYGSHSSKEELEIKKKFGKSIVLNRFMGKEEFQIEICNFEKFRNYTYQDSYGKGLKINIPIKREIARFEKKNLRVIASIKITQPYFNIGEMIYRQPYIDAETYRPDVEEPYRLIFAEIIQFIVYSKKTGKIYMRVI